MRILAFLVALLTPILAFSQGAIQQSGPVVAGHPLVWFFNGIAGDAGPATNGILSGIGVQNSGQGICQNNGPITAPFSEICLGFNGSVPTIYTSGPTAGSVLDFNINGTLYQFPGTGNGNVVGPASSVLGDVPLFNNTSGTALKDSGLPFSPTVATNAALKALTVGSFSTVYRTGFTTAADGGGMTYAFSGSSCSLNAGAGDNGSQVAPTTGTGCWLWQPPAAGSRPLVFGAVGNGSTDDTTALQAALTATTLAGIPLLIDGTHKYFISVGQTSTGTPNIQGDVGNLGIYTTSCPSGIIVNSDITALTLTGPSARVSHVCFQMAASSGTRASGAAIAVGATSGTQQGHAEVTSNTIIFSYNGIMVGGATTGTTQTNGDLVADNIIISPSNIGIGNGLSSTSESTNGTTIRDNQVYCGSSGSAATGIAIYDGSVRYYGSDGGPYLCNIGTALIPGASQFASGQFDGVLGDTNTAQSLLIDPSAGGIVTYARFTGSWTGYSTGSTNSSVKMTGAGEIKETMFIGYVAHSYIGQTVPLIDIENGTDTTITGSHIVADGGGSTTGPGIKLGASSSSVVIDGNFIGSFNGTLATGISVVSGASVFSITANNIGTATTALSYSPNNETAVIGGNIGVDNIAGAIASAGTITLPVNPTIAVSGTTTVTTINGAWSNRKVILYPTDASGFSITGGAGSACSNVVGTQNVGISLTWSAGLGCWLVG